MKQPKKNSDIALVERFRKGSLEAFEEIISRYEVRVYNLAMKFTRNPEDAEEVIQDVFTTLYQKIASFQGKAAFSSWLYRIVVNAAFMKLRKRKQNQSVFIEDLPAAMRAEYLDWPRNEVDNRSDSIAIHKELRDTLEDAIGKLPEQYRAVFILRDVDGLSNEEVSEILTLSVPAVKSRLHRSRLMLRRKLLRFYREYVGDKDLRPNGEEVEAELLNVAM